ncbi:MULTISPECIES: TrbI/VirB10 family protein [Nostoc]|uniref:Conjugal transfer protein TrbI n=1 Tax=Nostoc paludosum FACHB-159 TaxID=2692908 RepID=A0ABR8KEY5_9NOSO|nr:MULTISPECIES: TrbI/VirB10 family protein [Nostoc]MBD2680904.1 hypothetical protein [Nostoc sp. FACHB-857]MBD2737381.1 hypothetical protein [Nostoc paludosum FACHB-159]
MSNQVAENSQATTEINHLRQEFAQMNGAEIKNDSATSSTESTGEAQKTEPEEIVTTRTVAGHPLLKGLTISGGVLLLVLTFGAMVGTITGALNSSGENQTQETTKNIQSVDSKSDKDEDAEMKTVMALTSQKGELQAISKKNSETVSVSPAPTLKVTPTTIASVKTQPTPTRLTTYQAPPPPTPITKSSRSYPVAFNPPIRQVAPVSLPKPIPAKTSIRNSTPLPLVKTTPKDPMQEWLAVANVGNYSSGDSDNGELNNEELNLGNAKIEGGTGIRPTSLSNRDRDSPQLPPTNYDGKQVLVGTRAVGVMETPIAWVGSGISNQQQEQNSLIRLSQPLKAFDGSEVLPKGSYIVATLNPTNSEIAQMTAVSALVNIDGKTQEKQLPPNSILILGKNGNLLKAESRKGGSNLGNSLMSSLLSGLSKAAEIQNRANSEISISSNGVTTTNTSNGDKDLVAGFTEGSINEVLSRMKTSNEQQLQGLQQQQQVFVIEAGKQVQIFVNQSTVI